jgi:hypothetical protein
VPIRYALSAGAAAALVARDGRRRVRAPGCAEGGSVMNAIVAVLADVSEASLDTKLFFDRYNVGRFSEPFYVSRPVDCVVCGLIMSRGVGTLKAVRSNGDSVTFVCCIECADSAGEVLRAMGQDALSSEVERK